MVGINLSTNQLLMLTSPALYLNDVWFRSLGLEP
jgi:hypothetical protein